MTESFYISNMQSITVFCGSSPGINPEFAQNAYALGKFLAQNKIHLVFGGAKVGLMGAVAQGCLEAGGKVTGILPHFLKRKEIVHEGLTELIMVESMHERKMKLHEMGDGIIALPGGFGTLEELFEILTWAQLGLVKKPIGLLNWSGYYDALLQLLDHMCDQSSAGAISIR